MNKNSNTYIIIYAAVMVTVVALVLSFAALELQPKQRANAETEMKGAILQSVGLGDEISKVKDKVSYTNELYDKYIVDAFAVDAAGEKVAGADAFAILGELQGEYDKPAAERILPVFVSRDDAGATRYIVPMRGSGLWGAIWGYLALEEDWSTISGAVFDHTGETPGLGAEIATPAFGNLFAGKTIFKNGAFTSVAIVKNAPDDAVDAISGGTITSRGVESMLRENLKGYLPYIEKHGK
jgi:Na+-transporting NADH:ubiquinone oxidoreductase subunit C